MQKLTNALSLLILGTAFVGCQTLKKSDDGGYVVHKEPVVKKPTNKSSNPIAMLTGNHLPKGTPESIIPIWKDATLTLADQQPTRGFGGRLYFYDRNENPIVVDGELVIYGFNDDKGMLNEKPEKKFVFTSEELKAHMSVSSAGPSYSIWLPWDHINGDEKKVSLVAAFKERGKNGRICTSEQISTVLPGNKPVLQRATDDLIEEILTKDSARKNTKQVGFNEETLKGSKKIRSHEIKIPKGSRERLFGTAPTASYRLPEPKVMRASAIEPIKDSATSPQSASSLPDPRQAQSGQFVRQGKLPPGKKPPRLGVKSYSAKHQ